MKNHVSLAIAPSPLGPMATRTPLSCELRATGAGGVTRPRASIAQCVLRWLVESCGFRL